MPFITDKQTMDDLHIFGRQGSGSIYSLFNCTATAKGALLLEEMFRYPLSEQAAINQRSAAIHSLAKQQTVFPFKAEWIDYAEQYLDNTDLKSRQLETKQSVSARLNGLVAGMDATYKVISNGVKGLIEIIRHLHVFLDTQVLQETREMKDLIEGVFIHLVKENVERSFTREEMLGLDKFLRFGQEQNVRKVLDYIYALDVHIAVAQAAVRHGFGFADALPANGPELRITGMYHPWVSSPVTNDLTMAPDSNVIFLTGGNMAGKSTFMKSLGVNLYLAHMGFPVAAQQMEFRVLDGIYTTINLPDNLGIGASHFYAEVLRLKKIAEKLRVSKNMLIIFDELFRGTNVKDAYDATVAVTTAFAKKQSSLFVISTHIIEAGPVLESQCDNIRFKYLPATMKDGAPVYTYKLEAGITADRHGMVIINNEGILDILNNGEGKTN
jgi:DNA mismatch repair protein MutS